MKEQLFSWDLFHKTPIVGIVRNISFDDLSAILPVYYDAGLSTIEITMNTPGAAEMIGYAVEHYGDKLNIGAGTVCTKDDLRTALAAGAQFIVTPVLNKKLIQKCTSKNIPIFPGAFTPTEIYEAWKAGASMVKIFPAASLGPNYIKEVKGPLDQIKLMPTGGITLDNLTVFAKAGADGFGIGSQLFNKELIQKKDWKGLEKHFKEFVKIASS